MFDLSSQLLWITAVQQSFLQVLHPFFLALKHFDTTPYYLLVCALIMVVAQTKKAPFYIYMLCFYSYSTHALKQAFDMPRPVGLDPQIPLIPLTKHFGFPSGAAMGSVFLGFLIYRAVGSNRLGVGLGALYVGMLSLSRVYLGVHFPIDILGGVVFGLTLLVGFLLFERLWFARERVVSRATYLALISVALLTLYVFNPHQGMRDLGVLLFGFALGRPWLEQVALPAKGVHLLVQMTGVMGLFLLSRALPDIAKYPLYLSVGLWMSLGSRFGAQLITKRVGL